MASLTERHCQPLKAGTPALTEPTVRELLAEVGGHWRVADGRLQTAYAFPDFAAALAFTNTIGAIAEAENHHPDIYLAWGKVTVEVWTHSIGGLSENDFILAARIEAARPAA